MEEDNIFYCDLCGHEMIIFLDEDGLPKTAMCPNQNCKDYEVIQE